MLFVIRLLKKYFINYHILYTKLVYIAIYQNGLKYNDLRVINMVKNRIRDLREDKDLLQKDLAKVLNCSQVCYSRYELGLRDIPTDILRKLADFHNTSIDYLLLRTDNPHPYPPSHILLI